MSIMPEKPQSEEYIGTSVEVSPLAALTNRVREVEQAVSMCISRTRSAYERLYGVPPECAIASVSERPPMQFSGQYGELEEAVGIIEMTVTDLETAVRNLSKL